MVYYSQSLSEKDKKATFLATGVYDQKNQIVIYLKNMNDLGLKFWKINQKQKQKNTWTMRFSICASAALLLVAMESANASSLLAQLDSQQGQSESFLGGDELLQLDNTEDSDFAYEQVARASFDFIDSIYKLQETW